MKKILRLPAVLAVAVLALLWSSASLPTRFGAGVENRPGEQSTASDASGLRPSASRSRFNLPQEVALPPLHDGDGDMAAQLARGTQVFQRAKLLNIDSDTAVAAWSGADDTVTANRAILPTLLRQQLPTMTFEGTQLSQLSAMIAAAGPAHITVTSRTLQADTALTITAENVVVDFAGAVIESGANAPLWLVELVDASNVAVINANVNGGRNGFLVDGGSNIAIERNTVRGLAENGVVVTGRSSGVNVSDNHLSGLGRAGIMLHGPVSKVVLQDNEITDLIGHSNWFAGIVLTSRGSDIRTNPGSFLLPDGHWVLTSPLVQRLENPHQNVILGNTVRAGLSSGIYNDGAIANVFLDNRIEGNSKEGICFDNGATANVFAGNLVIDNGKRWGQPDAVLALDSVLGAGRGADGMSMAKLPGISIDNALYNEIFANTVIGNFGGGVKMVRTAFFNVVRKNAVIDNNLGKNAKYHFFGIELGAAPADEPVVDLDFVGSSGNIILANAVRGAHYSGVFIGSGSVQNDVLYNDISEMEVFALESARP
jgi:ABC-type amino acid transport system permease subunit